MPEILFCRIRAFNSKEFIPLPSTNSQRTYEPGKVNKNGSKHIKTINTTEMLSLHSTCVQHIKYEELRVESAIFVSLIQRETDLLSHF